MIGTFQYEQKKVKYSEIIEGKVIDWGNGSGVRIPKRLNNKKVMVVVLE